MRELAIFDLDNTLLAGDSDYLWGQFLVRAGVVDGAEYEARNRAFYDDYLAGKLDIEAFARFAFAVLAAHPVATLEAWRADFIERDIRPIVAPGAPALLDEHRSRGDELLIITATNRFVTEPIAALLDVPHLLATEPAMAGGRYTGELTGIPCFQDGKVARLEQWLASRPESYGRLWFYSDSINDAPLLDRADQPYAVDPCPRLRTLADTRGWPVISLR